MVLDNRLDQIKQVSHQINSSTYTHFTGMQVVVQACDDKLKEISNVVSKHEKLNRGDFPRMMKILIFKNGDVNSMLKPVQILSSSKEKDVTEGVKVNLVADSEDDE